MIDRSKPGIAGDPQPSDRFGYNVAVGDFDRDGYDDLVAAVPYQAVGGDDNAGAVQVIYGSRKGLRKRDRIFTQDSPGIRGDAAGSEYMGYYALTTGDFNGDRRDDVAIEVAYDTVGALEDAGAVNVLYGSRRGLTKRRNQLWSQDSPGIQGDAEASEYLGYEGLIAGDFDGDGRDDLAVGASYDNSEAGAVDILYGRRAGLRAQGADRVDQDTPGVGETAEVSDYFGYALAASRFNRGRRADLAIAAPYETLDSSQEGVVHVLYGRRAGLRGGGSDLFVQGAGGLVDDAEPGDQFGWAFGPGNFNGRGPVDLAIGVPYEAVGSADDAGAVHLLRARRGGLSARGDRLISKASPGILGDPAAAEYWGYALPGGAEN